MRGIIVLERLDDPQSVGFNAAFWVAVPAARQKFYANPAAVSAWRDIAASELADLRAGKFREIVVPQRFTRPTSTNAIKAQLVVVLGALQAAEDARNDWSAYGTSFETTNTTWSDAGVP